MKPSLLIATRSTGKQREIESILQDLPYRLVFPDDLGLPERSEEEVLENTGTFEGNARREAENFFPLSGLPTVADDSGLEVFALAGSLASGRAASRYVPATPRVGSWPTTRSRRASYRCDRYVPDPRAPALTFEGACLGAITETPRGMGRFGYDQLFLLDELGQTLAPQPRKPNMP